MADDNNGSGEQDGWTDERRPDQPAAGNDRQQPAADDDERQDDRQQPAADDDERQDDRQQPAGNDDEHDEHDEQPADDDEHNEQPGRGNAEAAKYRRQRNEARQKAEDYGRRLFTELVRSSGKLTDATDMPYSAELLDSPEELAAAIDELIAQKPHLKARQFENIGQHGRAERPSVSLADILRSNA